jgi:hypothetical protein
MPRVAKFLSFSNVIACLALFVALGGSVYAAGKINGGQIKRSSLPGNRIKPKTIPSNRIKPKSLTGRQVKRNSLTGAQINQKTLTKVSAAALATVQYEARTVTLTAERGFTSATAECPAGSYVIGGGATLSNPNEASLRDSGPTASRAGWTASGAGSWPGVTMTVTAICAAVEKPSGSTSAASATTVPAPPLQYNPAR